MEIKLEKLEVENNKLKQLLNEYESNYLNIYNELESTSFIWQGEESNDFNHKVETDKIKLKNTYEELKQLDSVYNYLINDYQSIGQDIFFDMDKISGLNDYFDKTLTSIVSVIDYYDILDTSFCPAEASIIDRQKNEIGQAEKDLFKVKQDTKSTFDKIDKIERTVNSKLSGVDVEFIKED